VLIRSVRHGLRRLSGRDRWEVLGFLRQHAEHNAYLLGQIARDALHRESIAGVFVGYYAGGALEGVVCIGSNLVVSEPCSERALDGFASFARSAGYLVRVAVGPDICIDGFMRRFGRVDDDIALERPAQLLYRVDHTTLDVDATCPELRPADVSELERLLRTDLAMVVEELGFDPFSHDIMSYRRGWLRRIREQRAWVVGIIGQPPIFKVDQSAVCEDVVQLAGVYTHPAWRGQGIARRAVGEMCRMLLEEVPVVTLYVHRDNTAAIRLYEGLGFEPVGDVRSVWFY
jgi:hypothetical protein